MAPSSPENRAPAEARAWKDRRGLAAAVRLAAFLGPIAASVAFVAVASRVYPKPSGFWPSVGWWIALTVSATLVMTLVERLLRRVLPIPALFRLSLVFPDHAPSRYKVAMRTNTLRALERTLAAGERPEGSDSFQEAAETVVALATALSNHDRRTRGHTERVRAYSLMIGEELKLPSEDLERLHWAGMIHDIGKLEVPRAILNKPGRPDEDEWKVLQQHPAAGERLVEPLRGWLGDWADAASQHHERVDGKGYPFGLSGDEISLSGRIVAVADAYDVMTSVRSYKSAMTPEEARAELVRCSGTQFDAKVVRAFLNVSVGRLRGVMGPLSWAAQAPALGNVPIGAAVGSAMSGIASVFVAGIVGLTGGASADPTPPPRDLAFAAAPTAAPLRVVLDEDTTGSLALSWPDGAPDRLRVTADPDGVRVSFSGGQVIATPDPDVWGTVRGRYEACWRGACSSSSIEVSVRSVNDAPVAVADVAAAVGGTTAELHPLVNDVDADGDALRVETVRSPDDVDATSDGRSVWFTAAPLAEGRVTLSYDVVDPAGLRATAEISVDVVAGIHQPVAADDTVTVAEDAETTSVDVVSNDTDVDLPGDALAIRIVGAPSIGTATVPGRHVVYRPNADVSGVDVVTYQACDTTGLCDTATLVVTVVPVNDPPTFATAGGVRVDEDAPATIVRWATNVSAGPADETTQRIRFDVTVGDPSLFSSPPAVSPEGFLSFQPAPDAHGQTTMTVVARDDGGRGSGGTDSSDSRTAAITVTAVNDPVVAVDDVATVLEDTSAGVAIDVLANDSDVDGDTLTVTAVDDSALVGGSITRTGGVVTYTPDADFHGVETLAYTVADGQGSTATATVTVTVTPANDAVVAVDDSASVAEDTPGGVTIDVLANDTDVDGDTLTVSGVDSAALVGGTLGGSGGLYTYTPDPNWWGVETFDYWVTDGAGSTEVATVTITVTSVNDPVVAADDVATISEDDTAGVVIDLLGNDTDADGDTLSVVSTDTTGIVDGSLVESAGVYTYTPNANFNGTETFDYTVADGNGSTDTATATITVTAVPDDPIVATDAYAIAENGSLAVAAPGLLDNDADEDGETLTVDTTPVAPVSNGVLALQANGAFSYTPNPGFRGTDTFAYRAGDGTGRFGTTLVNITVDSGLSSGAFYLGTGASGALPLLTAPLATTGAEGDHDGDGDPGLSLRMGGDGLVLDILGLVGLGADDEIVWGRNVGAQPLVLNGPINLQLWSAVRQYRTDRDARPHVLLYDCNSSGTGCTTIAESDQSIDPYNPNPGFAEIPITLGNVSHTVAAGRQLMLRLLVLHEDLWIAASGPRPSRIEFTLANAAPVAVGDAPGAILEDAATVNVDVLGNDADLNLVPSSVTVTVPPSSGTAVARANGTIDYTPDPDANGADPFTYQVCDTGGLCDSATVTMSVTAVNDRPTFTAGPDVTSSILAGPYSAPWATGISRGPVDEAGQTLTFTATAADPLLFVDQPQVSPTGVLTFTTIGILGSTTVDVVMTDSGGAANGGNPTSVTRTFTVTFSP